jgi:FixJ family two-component response regulator
MGRYDQCSLGPERSTLKNRASNVLRGSLLHFSTGGSGRRRYDSLKPREREVLAGVVSGLLNKQIADEAGATERTVKFHRGNIMRKMQVKSLAEQVRMAEAPGIARQGS